MKVFFRSSKIVLLSTAYTINTCARAVIMHFNGKINRPWVDRALSKWSDKLLRLVQVTCIVINPNQVKPLLGKPTIIMCNHSSLYDIPLSFKAFSNCSIRMLAKKELSTIPIMGKGMRAAEFPFIDRKNRHQALKDLALAQRLMESGIVIWVAPEGTRSKDGKLTPFKKGAFLTAIAAKATIIPIGIQGAHEILPIDSLVFNLNRVAKIYVGEPIDAAIYQPVDKDILIEKVYSAIQTLISTSA